MGPVRRRRRGECALPLERELLGHRLSGQTHGDAPDPGAGASGVLADVDPRDLHRRSLDRASLPRGALAGKPAAATGRARAAARCAPGELASAGGDGRGARRPSHPRRDRARAHRRGGRRARRVHAGRCDARPRLAAERRRVHRVELRAPADAARPGRLAASLPGRGGSLRPARVRALPVVRRPRTRRAGGQHLPRGAVSRAPRVPPALGAGPQADGAGTFALRGDARARALVSRPRRLPLRGASAGIHPQPAARGFRRGHACGLLPALRRRHGPHAANARHPGARGRRLHGRHVEGRGLDCHRPTGPRVGRGVVRGVRLARVRPDAGPGDALCDLHARVGLRRRRAGARNGPLPRPHRTAADGGGGRLGTCRDAAACGRGCPVVVGVARGGPVRGRVRHRRREAGAACAQASPGRPAPACRRRARGARRRPGRSRCGRRTGRDAVRARPHGRGRAPAPGGLARRGARRGAVRPAVARPLRGRARAGELLRMLRAAAEREAPRRRLRAALSLRSLRAEGGR